MGDFGTSFSLFSVFSTVIIGIVLIVVVYKLIQVILNMTADKVTVDATLISKDTSTSHNRSDTGTSSNTAHSFTFETIYGERVILDVSYKVFREYAIGDTGELTYQRKWLKEFKLTK